jgi:DNA-directed RNA polymerase subunit A"
MAVKSKKQIDVGEAVGIVAAQSIGEPGTQMSLPYEERVMVKMDGEIRPVRIGEFIDSAFERFGYSKEGEHEICDLPAEAGVFVPSLLQSEKIEWCRVSALTRHRSPKKLLTLSLRSGRKITATPFHSFVIRQNNEIVAVAASALRAGMRLPVIRSLALAEGQKSGTVSAKEVLQSRLKYMVSRDGRLYAYARESSRPMDEQLQLDSQFGWLVGIYLAEGNATRNFVSISNTNPAVLQKVRSFADSSGFTHNEYDNFSGFAPSHDIRINSTLLSEFLKATCGTSSYEKRAPAFAYCADEAFIGSLLRGYFDGDGNVSIDRRVIRASSKSKELVDGVCMLLARLGIFASKRSDKKTHNVSISYRYAPRFLQAIGSDVEGKRLALQCLAEISSEQGYNLVDVIPGIGGSLMSACRKAGIPSRLANSFTKRGRIGRSTLQKYTDRLSAIAQEKSIELPELPSLARAAESDVVWDEIEKMEYAEPSNRHVYDFTVPQSETFATFDGVITHNTMRTFHYAGVAEQVPTGLPRLIELVDARKEPKKPIMDIFLKGDAAESYEKAKEIAKSIECTTLDKIAYVEEDFEEKKILITLEPSELEAEGVEAGEVAKRVKASAGSHVEHKDNLITVKPSTSSLRNIRRLTNKLRLIHIKGAERINRTIVVKGKDGKYFIRTSGSNLAALIKNPKIDTERLYTNDVQEIARVLGIEAARNSLVKEIKQVLDMQNLNVDVRHCMLLADAMTMNGEIKSIGRHGLSGEKAGVLARAAFEETVKHLINAAVKGEDDKLIGVTENIIIGQTVPVGTGLVRLKMKLG